MKVFPMDFLLTIMVLVSNQLVLFMMVITHTLIIVDRVDLVLEDA